MRTIAILTMVLAFAVPARAQYAEDVLRFSQFGPAGTGASLARGNASVGLADSYSALFWNPAGLSQLKNYEFTVGASYLDYGNTIRYLGTRSDGSQTAMGLNNLGIVYPIPTIRGGLTFALGYQRVANYTSQAEFNGYNVSSSIVPSLLPDVDLSTLSAADRQDLLDNNIPYQLYLADISGNRLVTPINGDVRQTVVVREGGGADHWSFGGGIDVAKELSLGATVSVVSGTYTYDRTFLEEDVQNAYQKAPGDTLGLFDRFQYINTINSDLSGFNAVFGLHYRKQGKYRIGLTVRTPTYYTIRENFTEEAGSQFDPNLDGTIDRYDIAFDGTTEYRISTPAVVSLGAVIQLADWLAVSGDAEYTDWRTMKFVTTRSDLMAENRLIRDFYRATVNLRAGAELTLWELGLKLRGGVQYRPSPYEGDPREFDQQYYSAGAGFRLDENVWLDAGYSFGTWKTFRDNYAVGSVVSRTDERIKTHQGIVTLSFMF